MAKYRRQKDRRAFIDRSLVKVKYMGGYVLQMTFADGLVKIIDLTNWVNSTAGDVAAMKNVNAFKRPRIKDGDLFWGNYCSFHYQTFRNSEDGSDIIKKPWTAEEVRQAFGVSEDIEDPIAFVIAETKESAKAERKRNREAERNRKDEEI